MDEKKLEQVENLEDEQLEGINGGARLPMDNARAVRIDTDDEELDGGIPHLPPVRPKADKPGGASDSW